MSEVCWIVSTPGKVRGVDPISLRVVVVSAWMPLALVWAADRGAALDVARAKYGHRIRVESRSDTEIPYQVLHAGAPR